MEAQRTAGRSKQILGAKLFDSRVSPVSITLKAPTDVDEVDNIYRTKKNPSNKSSTEIVYCLNKRE